MAFNIEEFKSVIDKNNGILRTNKFLVQFPPPPILIDDSSMFRDLEYFAEQITLPGVNLSAHDVRRYGYGPIEKRPISHSFTDLSVMFILDGNSNIHRLMHKWISAISPFDMRDGIAQNNAGPYLLNYRNEYITDLNITVFNEQGDDTESIKLIIREAFPMAIADGQFNWSEFNNHARMTVQFSFIDWYLEKTPGNLIK